MCEDIISIKGLCKSFGAIKAVNDLSFSVKEGELFAFLGVNGAGKSTTISMLCGQLAADEGTIFVSDCDVRKTPRDVKKSIGVVFQNSYLDSPLSVLDNLKSRASLYGLYGAAFNKRLEELTELLDLGSLLKRPVGKLSGGQRRRIDIARALLNTPKLLILDEPTTGLDPQTRKMIWGVIEKLRRDCGMTVLLTTHYMEEAADADHVVIIDGGKKIAEGTPLELKNRYAHDYLTVYGVSEDELGVLGLPYESIGDGYCFSVADPGAVRDMILAHPAIFKDFEVVKGKMDDVFLNVTGKKPEAASKGV
ncbi:MAG: ABC transporter ATP-binding protein [Clostridia bacterium]|nr:ABC transporter ATP-binding protein [Clostridia bacterium]